MHAPLLHSNCCRLTEVRKCPIIAPFAEESRQKKKADENTTVNIVMRSTGERRKKDET